VVFSERESEFTLYVVVRPSVVCLSVVCNFGASYSRLKCFSAIWYPGHPLTSTENFTEIVSGKLLRRGLNARGVAKYSDFGPIEGYISETVQDRR